jgi:lipopolysaccharide biosynthesis glycosyltransferase
MRVMAADGRSSAAKQVVKKIGRRTPGLQAVVSLRDDNHRLAEAQRATQLRLDRSRKRVQRTRARLAELQRRVESLRERLAETRADLRELRRERNETQRQLDRLDEAAEWLAEAPRPEGSRPDVALRSRIAAAGFVEALSRGEDPSTAFVAYAQHLTTVPRYPFRYRLPALAGVLERFDEFRPGVHAALAVHGYHTDHLPFARHHLDLCGDDAVALVPVEYARVLIAADPSSADEVFETVLRGASPTPTQWLDILSAISASHDLGALGRATARLAAQAGTWSEDDRRVFARFVDYGARSSGETQRPAADVRFGVMGYRRADLRLSSRNVGDYIQTISALGHLLRRTGLRLTGEPDLVETATVLRSRVRPDLLIDDDDATVELIEVSRDDSSLDDVPDGTWYVAFGWHLHADALGGHGLPYHPGLRPVFVSFHVNRRDMLSDDAVDYLRTYAPIGCRDWYTVDLLTRLGVPAFFTGCLTTTVDGYFADDIVDTDRPPGFVDARPVGGGTIVRQAYEEVRDRSLADSLQNALDTLDGYVEQYGSLTTGRLHCYLPATSIGIPTTFAPKRPYDVRFEGLTDSSADLDAIRKRLRHTLLEPVLAAIVGGSSEEEVYALWRSITEPMVTDDAAARATAFEWPTTTMDIDRTLTAIRQGAWARPVPVAEDARVVDLCVGLDQNYLTQLYTVIDRCLERTDRPIRLWGLVRGLDTSDHERFAAAFPEVDVTFFPCDAIDYGDVFVSSKRITVSTMDRLLLPHLLSEVDKAVYIDLDLLPRADIGELYDTELGDAPLAASRSHAKSAMGGVTSFVDVAHTYFPDGPEGWRMLNLVHRQAHAGDVGFNAGVLALNLARMRADDFLARYAGFAEQFGLNDQYVLNLYAGDSFVDLDGRWNSWPDRDVLDDDVAIVHWVGPLKPWGDIKVAFQDEWQAAVAAMKERRGGPAPTGR